MNRCCRISALIFFGGNKKKTLKKSLRVDAACAQCNYVFSKEDQLRCIVITVNCASNQYLWFHQTCNAIPKVYFSLD